MTSRKEEKRGGSSSKWNSRIGRLGESLAVNRLLADGHLLLQRNWRSAYGEIDIVTRSGETVVFHEVKTRTGKTNGLPEESITLTKRNHLLSAALAYLQEHELADSPWRIDVIAVEIGRNGETKRIEVIENAVHG